LPDSLHLLPDGSRVVDSVGIKLYLNHIRVEFIEIDVSGDPKGRSDMVARAQGRMTVPQIFIGSTHVGGSDDLHALERAGKLDALLGRGDALAGAGEGS